MNAEQIAAAFAEINARTEALASRALAGAQSDELIPECDELFDVIARVLTAVSPRHEIIGERTLRRAVFALTGGQVPYEQRYSSIRRACDYIARLEASLSEIVKPAARHNYGR